jgi:hypothetical protein
MDIPVRRIEHTNKRTSVMKTIPSILAGTLALSLVVATATANADEPTFGEQFQKQIDDLMPNLAKGDRNAQQSLQQTCFAAGTPGRDSDRTAAVKIIVAALEGELEKPAKLWLIKQCQHIGDEQCVAVLTKSLGDGDVHISDAARRALTANPSAAANEALAAKLTSAKGSDRIPLINALGYRADAASIAPLGALLKDKDAKTASAAAIALGKIATPDAVKALKSALGSAPDAVKTDIADACLACAEALLSQGNRKEAIVIYTDLSKANLPKEIRLAAVRGKLKAAGN